MSERDIQIALMTAMQESSLRNLHGGDRDSQGLFQQRPSQGWGTVAQVTDPYYASKKFYSVLKGVKNRDSLTMGQAAQRVQRSKYPDAYDKWQGDAGAFIHAGMDDRPGGFTAQAVSASTVPATPGMANGGASAMPATPGMAKGPVNPLAAPVKDTTPPVGYLPPNLLPDVAADGTTPLSSDGGSVMRSVVSAGMGGAKALSSPDGAPLLDNPAAGAAFDMTPVSESDFNSAMDRGGAQQQPGLLPTGTTEGGNKITSIAQQYMGTPYVWGGTTPSGFDCSGFVQYVYKKAGINIPRMSFAQANAGTRVGLNQLQAGDLVAWDNSSRNNGADHIAIYLGNGMIIEAPRPGLAVRIRKLGKNEGAWGVTYMRGGKNG